MGGGSANRQSRFGKGQSCNLPSSCPTRGLMGPGFQACLEILAGRESELEHHRPTAALLVVVTTKRGVNDPISPRGGALSRCVFGVTARGWGSVSPACLSAPGRCVLRSQPACAARKVLAHVLRRGGGVPKHRAMNEYPRRTLAA